MWERAGRWLVVFGAWGLSCYSLFFPMTQDGTLFHLLMVAFLLLLTEFFPYPGHDGRVTVHFPLLFALELMFSPGVAGIVYIVTTLSVTLLLGHSLPRAAFRTGYSIIGLFAVDIFLDAFGYEWLLEGEMWKQGLTFLICVMVYEVVSKGLRDGMEWLRPSVRPNRLWINNWTIETGVALLSWAYLWVYMLLKWQEQESLAVLFFFSPLAAFAILSHVIAKLIRKQRKLELLFFLTQDINRNLDLRKVMKQTILPLRDVIPYSFGVVHLLKGERLTPAITAGEFPDHLRRRSFPLNGGLSGWVASHGRSALVHHAKMDPRCQQDREDFDEVYSMIAVPLKMDGEVLGVITLGNSERSGFEEADLTFLEVLASQTVVAVRNSQLLEERERRSVAEERNRLAREIHDGIAQSFAGVLMKVESSLKVFHAQPEQVREWLEESCVKLREGLKEIRHSITALRPSPAQKIGLVPALSRRVEALQSETGVEAYFETVGNKVPLRSAMDETIYMVCHEALSNAAKHAQAKEIRVQLVFTDKDVKLIVQDDGIGFSLAKAVYKAEAQKRYGIVGMNERSQNVKAALQFDSEEGKGTTVTLAIPLEIEEEAVHAH